MSTDRWLERPLPGWLGGALTAGALGTILWLEGRRPLRRRVEPRVRHDARNGALAGLSAASIHWFEKPVVEPLSRLVHRRRWGLTKRLGLPPWAEFLLGIALLDYTLYVWHVLTHKVPFLWRFHEVHHADLDLDTTTAIRFHFSEMILSIPWRAAQVLVLGASPRTLSTWQTATILAILFHHSNLRLPHRLERVLSRVLVTPRVHGIHHSIVREETDSNWSTIFTWPDYLHRTARLDVPQDEITIGVPAYRDPRGLTIGQLIRMPFTRRSRPTWELPDGTHPRREEPRDANRLALAR